MSDWTSTRIGRATSLVDDRANGRDLELLSVSKRFGLVPRSQLVDRPPRADDLSKYKVVQHDDIVLNRMSAYQGAVGRSHQDGIVSPDYIVLRPGAGANSRFFHHLFRSKWFVSQMAERVKGIGSISSGNVRTPRIRPGDLARIEVPLPSMSQQRKIAGFLDRETERIDALIDKKRQLIDLLEEKRTATITQAVTKGIDSTAPMKPTDIPWLGDIPAHWEYRRLKHLMVSLVDTEHKTVHFVDGGMYPVIRTSDVRSGRVLLDQARRTDDAGYQEWTRRRRPSRGDVMLAREAPAGEACLVPQAPPVCLGQRMVLITPDPVRLLDSYLVYAIYSDPVQIFIELSSQGSTVAHLNMADIPEIPISLPSVQEQIIVVRYLDAQVERFNTIGQALNAQLTLLAEYREALITAAVTGEIDVDTFDSDHQMKEVTA